VDVIYTAPDGERRKLPVDIARVQGKLQELAHRPEAMVTWTAFLAGEIAARDEVEVRLDLRALFGTDRFELGPIARRERELAQRARERCRHLELDPADFPANPDRELVERAFRPLRKCLDRHMPPSPFEYVGYDEQGRELSRMSEPLISASYELPEEIEPAGREAPGAKPVPWRRPKGKLARVLKGRAPDGALYELVLHQDGGHGTCLMMRWPYVAEALAGGACGEIPPDRAFGRREPEQVAARAYGMLSDVPHATRWRLLSGFARPWVSRVRVVYTDEAGERHDAPLKLTQVRAEWSAPFGYWLAFLPPAAGKHPRFEVIAYREDGAELGSVRDHR
jgi:hypothetical protein